MTNDQAPGLVRLVKRLPFTFGYVVIAIGLSVALGTLWADVEAKPWFNSVGYGLPAFEEGRWHTLVFGCFFALYPGYYVFVVGLFAVLTGFAEWRLGTKRTAVITIGYQFVAVLLTALLFLVFRNTGWEWASTRSTERDVGFSAGMLAVLSAASATVRSPWRLRLRLAIWLYAGFSIMFVGQMADAEHFFAVVLSLPFSTRLAGGRAIRARAWPTRHELRLLAVAGVLLTASTQLAGQFLPDRLTPFGAVVGNPNAWYVLAANLFLAALLANGLRHGYRWAWGAALVQVAIPLTLIVVLVVLMIVIAIAPNADNDWNGLPQLAAGGLLSAAFFTLLLTSSNAFRVPRKNKRRLAVSGAHPDTAKQLLHQWGGSTISWMTTWSENRHMVTADGAGYLAFQKHAGVAVALGDPVCPPDGMEKTIADFADLCNQAALVPFIFSCSAETVAVTQGLGWKSAQVAEDNLIDLQSLEFKGKKWQDIRTALNKAAKEGIEFRMVTLSEQSWSLVRQVESLSAEWLGDKELPEMGFTLGGLTEALDPEVKVGIALDSAGTVLGVTSWMPVYGPEGRPIGWTLDLMRRKDGAFKATMEFLIASSCRWFQADGADFLSLSGAPLARSAADPTAENAVEKLLDSLGATLEPVYGFRSLHAFKSKFQPRFSPMYMVFRDEADLPRIGIAITRAYLPNASLFDLVGALRH